MPLMLPIMTYPALVPYNRAFNVERGLFACRNFAKHTILLCADVPRTEPDTQLWHEGKEVRGENGIAYSIKGGRRGGGARTMYMINCVDPKGTTLIIDPGVSRSEGRALRSQAAIYSKSNCKYVERKHKGRWVLGIRITRKVKKGQQLILPCYLR